MADRFPAVRVNLVERREWKSKWDSDDIMEYASNAAFHNFHNLGVADLELLVHDLAVAKGKRGGDPRKRFTSDQVFWMAGELKRGNPDLEETERAIMDASTYMFEEAMLPMRNDIRYAMELASVGVVSDSSLNRELWDPVLDLFERARGPKEWSPRKRYSVAFVLEQLADSVILDWKEGSWDRYLVFDFGNTYVAYELVKRSDWDQDSLTRSLQDEFNGIKDNYLTWFFSKLDRIMQDIDVSNRTDWRKHWRTMLRSGIASHIQREMAEAVREMPERTEGLGSAMRGENA